MLRGAGLARCWTQTPGRAHKHGFYQPQRIHEQWHTDIAYLNILGTNYFFISVLDGHSRAVIHPEVRLDMTTTEVEIVMERDLAHLPRGTPKPRLISDNGAQHVSRQFNNYLREREVSHSRARPYHPQSNGRMERFHKSLKVECVRVTTMADLQETRCLIWHYVQGARCRCCAWNRGCPRQSYARPFVKRLTTPVEPLGHEGTILAGLIPTRCLCTLSTLL